MAASKSESSSFSGVAALSLSTATAPFLWGRMVKKASSQLPFSRYTRMISKTTGGFEVTLYNHAELSGLLDPTMVPTGAFRTNTHLMQVMKEYHYLPWFTARTFRLFILTKLFRGSWAWWIPCSFALSKVIPWMRYKNATLRSSHVCASATQVQPDKPCDGCGPPVPLSHTPSSGPALPAHWESLTSGTRAPP